MDLNFYERYKDYSNIDLLKIAKRPGEYQPEAVAMANQLLNERQVISEEILFVDRYYEDIDNAIRNQKEKIDSYKEKVADFFQPIIHPTEKVEPAKWLNILLFIIVLQYAWSFYKTIRSLIRFLNCSYCRWDILYFVEILNLLYIPFIFYLLYKRKRWGWILLFADNLFTLISRLSQSYIFFKYQSIHQGSTTSFLFPILVKALFVFFLFRDSIANYFNINSDTKKKTAVALTIGTSFFILLMYFAYGF